MTELETYKRALQKISEYGIKPTGETELQRIRRLKSIADKALFISDVVGQSKQCCEPLSEGKPLDQFRFHNSWDEFMAVYSEIGRVWFNIPDYKKKKFKGTSTYRAIQNRILLGNLTEAFELSVAFVKEWNAFKADR